MIRRHLSNDKLLNLDIRCATREQKIEWLCQIITNEIEKPDEQRDNDLIMECSEYLDELSDPELVVSDKDIAAGLEKIKQSNKTDAYHKKRVWGIAVACLLAFVIITPIIATATGHNAFAFVSDWVKELFHMEPGEADVDGITIIKGSESKKYSGIEELLRSENLDIMYPGWLPDGISIKTIWRTNLNDNQYDLVIVFNTDTLNFNVSNYFSVDLGLLTDAEKFTYNDIDYFIKVQDDGRYYAVCQASGFEYSFLSQDKEILMQIIQNMKGLN